MQCREHPYRANLGGICAFCLQEKLQKLASSSDPFPAAHHSSSSPTTSSPSFRSTYVSSSSSSSVAAGTVGVTSSSRSRMSAFLYGSYSRGGYRSKKKDAASASVGGRRVKRVNTGRSSNTVAPTTFQPMDTPRRRWFWSFLSQHSNPNDNSHRGKMEDLMPPKLLVVVDNGDEAEESLPGKTTTFGSKVVRSRSVGCGSRSFSGDFLERISTGLGDCGALRRAESQREGKVALHRASTSAAESNNDETTGQQQRVKCGGIFGGFGMSIPTPTLSSTNSISSTSATAASYWAPEPRGIGTTGRGGKGWGWALASPMRVFRPSPTTTKTYVLNSHDDGGGAPTTPGKRRPVTGRVSNMVSAKG